MIDLQFLGTTAILDGHRPHLKRVLAQPKRLALFAYLVLATPRGFHRRDKLLALFWPDRGDADGRAALSDAVYFLRKRLGEDVIVSRGAEELAVAGERVRCDALEFDRALEEGRFQSAVDLYGGDLLDGFHLTGADEFERWLETERSRLRAGYARALDAVAVAQERDHGPDAAIESWRRLCSLDPYDSRNVLRLVGSLVRAVRPVAALREAEAHATLLQSELGMAPPEEVADVVDRLRSIPVTMDPVPTSDAGVLPATELNVPPDPNQAAKPVPGPNGPSSSRPLPRRGLVASVAVLVLSIAVATTYMAQRAGSDTGGALSSLGPPSDGEIAATSVAVLPFTVRGDPDVAYLSEGMVTLLATKLDGAGELRSVDPHTLLTIAGDQDAWDPRQASALAAHFGAGLYVVGDVVASGRRLHLDAALYEVGARRPITRAVVEGPGEDLFTLVDALAVELLATRLRRPEEGLRRAADLTTHSLPALRAFLAGERERRALNLGGAIEGYQRAVREDSTFALAHLRLASAVGWYVVEENLPMRLPAVEMALRHRERLSRRDRLYLDAQAAGVRGHAAMERLLRDLTARYPDDAGAWHALGDLLFHGNPNRGRSIYEARAPFELALALDPSNREFLIHLIHIARQERRFADMDALVDRMGERYPGYQSMMRLLGSAGGGRGSERPAHLADLTDMRRPLQLQVLLWTATHGPAEVLAAALDLHAAQPLALDPGPAHWPDWRPAAESAQLALWLGRLSEGQASLAELRRQAPDQAVLYEAWWKRAPFVPAAADDLARLREEVAALSPDTSPWPAWDPEVWRLARLMLLGVLSVRLEDLDAAMRHASALESLDGPHAHGALARVGSQTVRAMVARAQGRAADGLRLLESVESEMFGLSLWAPTIPDFTLQRFLRAELLLELGREEEALEWYPYHSWEMWLFGPMFVPFSHLRVAQIHDRIGDAEAAIHHYTLFTLLWRDADPASRTLVSQAERRLEALLRRFGSPGVCGAGGTAYLEHPHHPVVVGNRTPSGA